MRESNELLIETLDLFRQARVELFLGCHGMVTERRAFPMPRSEGGAQLGLFRCAGSSVVEHSIAD